MGDFVDIEIRLEEGNKLPSTIACPMCLGMMFRGWFRRLRYKCRACGTVTTLRLDAAKKEELRQLQMLSEELKRDKN